MTGPATVPVDPDLLLDDVTVGYPGAGPFRGRRHPVVILSGLHLRARAGRLTVLLGGNGSGKSTLLRSMAGLQPLVGGAVRLGDQRLDRMPPPERAARVAVVLTESFDPGLLRGADVVDLGRYPHRRRGSAALDSAAVRDALAAVHAQDLARVPLARMSDGQRQRVMIARALAQEPALLLLDEPTAFLDAPARLELLAVLQRIAAARGIPVVLSSHDVELAVRAGHDAWLVGAAENSDGVRTVISGPVTRLAADGAIGAAFDTDAVTFDPSSGRFALRAEMPPPPG